MSTEDAIGFVRAHGRIGEGVQRSDLNADGVRGIVTDRAALERMACHGRTFKLRHLFLLADPKAKRTRKDLLDTLGRIEKRGAVLKDVSMQMTTADPEHRYKMLLVAVDQLANNGRSAHLNRGKQGRKLLVFSPDVEAKVERVWLNRRDYQTEAEASKAIAKLDKRYSAARARRTYGPRIKPKK